VLMCLRAVWFVCAFLLFSRGHVYGVVFLYMFVLLSHCINFILNVYVSVAVVVVVLLVYSLL